MLDICVIYHFSLRYFHIKKIENAIVFFIQNVVLVQIIIFKKGKIIENVIVTNSSFLENYKYKNCFFHPECGDIKMTKCQFNYCYTTADNGGGI